MKYTSTGTFSKAFIQNFIPQKNFLQKNNSEKNLSY